MNKNIVVTGGSFGIGRATVEAFLAEGDRVIFTARNEEKANGFLMDAKDFVREGKLHFLKCDNGLEEDIKKLALYVHEKFGYCDVLVNNAAVYKGGMVHENTAEDFDFQFGINVRGVFLTCKYFLTKMIERRSGNIVNISSLAGLRGEYNMAIYAATKAALVSLTRSMGLDYARYGIRVNGICPSATATPMFLTGTIEEQLNIWKNNNPTGRIGEASDIAPVVVFLASDNASYINAQLISVDGGLSSWSGEPRQDRVL